MNGVWKRAHHVHIDVKSELTPESMERFREAWSKQMENKRDWSQMITEEGKLEPKLHTEEDYEDLEDEQFCIEWGIDPPDEVPPMPDDKTVKVMEKAINKKDKPCAFCGEQVVLGGMVSDRGDIAHHECFSRFAEEESDGTK